MTKRVYSRDLPINADIKVEQRGDLWIVTWFAMFPESNTQVPQLKAFDFFSEASGFVEGDLL